MSAYRSELEAARQRLAAVEEQLADRDSQLARISPRKGGARRPWWRSTVLGAGAVGLLLGGALCTSAIGELPPSAAGAALGDGLGRARGSTTFDLTRVGRRLALAAERLFRVRLDPPLEGVPGAPSSSTRASRCASGRRYRTPEDLPSGALGVALADDSGNSAEYQERPEGGWHFGRWEHEEPEGPRFPVSGALTYSNNAPDLQPLHFAGGRLLSLRESLLVLFELDQRTKVFGVYVRHAGSPRSPETRRATLVGYGGGDEVLDETVLEYGIVGDLPGRPAPQKQWLLVAVEACDGLSLRRARLDLGHQASIYSVFVYPPPPGATAQPPPGSFKPKPDFD